jgi:iron complex transport system substrate-binding protein
VGIPTIAINPQSIDDVLIMIKFLGTITGHSSEADAIIAEMNGKIDAVKTKVEGIPLEERPLIYYELKTPMKTTGPGTFTDELIRTAGGINLAADRPERYPILNSEYIIQKNPDIIIVVDYGTSPDEIKARGGWDTIKAVKDDHVYSIDTHWVTSNPRIVKGLEQFAHYF